MLSIYIIVDSVTVSLLLILMALALSTGGYKHRINRLFAAFTIMMACWLPSVHIGNSPSVSQDVATVANFAVFACSFSAGVLFTKIVVLLSDLSWAGRVFFRIEWLLWIVALMSATPLVGAGVERQGDINAVIFGPLAGLYGIALMIMLTFMGGVVVQGMRESKEVVRNQLRAIGIALLLTIPLIVLFSYILPVATGKFATTEFGTTPIVLVVVTLYYSVARHQLFDIRMAAVRVIGYTLTLSVMTGLYMLSVYGVSVGFFGGTMTNGVGMSPMNIVIALLMALAFQPIKHFFDQFTNRIFYQGQYDQVTFIREFGKILSYDTDLRLLLRQASKYIASNLKADTVFFVIPERGTFGVFGGKRTRIPAVDVDIINQYYQEHYEFPSLLVADVIKADGVRKILGIHQVRMVLPLILQKQPIGYLFIGEHKSRGYTIRDVRVLESVANELAIAVQNSLSVEEIRELNESLKNKVDTATQELRDSNRQLQRLDEAKNEFISMASHQLRTPLTSIKGYLDMVLQGDLGKVSATQRAVLTEAFVSSERMVTLINDFLNVSRLQTGKFVIDRVDGDLKEILQDQLSMLRGIAKQHDLTIKTTIDKSIPRMHLDVEKLRQVVLNFIDNAIYYSKPGSTVHIKLKKDKHYVTFIVKDTGIGVPKSEQPQLFGRFFRATNARQRRPDGTGVGLFLAKKVVLLHGGQIIFESEEGKGSTFGFRLPIKQPKTNS